MTQLDPTLKAEHLETLFRLRGELGEDKLMSALPSQHSVRLTVLRRRAVDKDGDGKVKFNHFTDW
eukprot:CAMPEP_0203940350 /NCGR_PEP_ID=MMETSP0359-20131031/76959_1 /ASSEMBLY_ACC=CAM_ASM_000338 /TAXON_ID=268821 /ORGANISM="Scrippsiella Hangoei, Strain SHTV-5" /LENGTH=64 /DNA_ID=CAMNT_0050870775 /DNA_START=5 /DNA_END=197 /DNA_ORIENTATION=-